MSAVAHEAPKHAEAYAYYLQLGGKRSYMQVAQKFNVSKTSVAKWAKSFHWRQRILDAENKAQNEHQAKEEGVYAANMLDFTRLKDELLKRLCDKVNEDSCSVYELSVIYKIVKTELGEPTVIKAAHPSSNERNPFEEILEAMFAKHSDSE